MTATPAARTICGMPNADVRQITPADVIDLRWRILRAGLPRETSIYPDDDAPSTVHFGMHSDAGDLIASATFLRHSHEGQPAWRLRGMAVDASIQRSGLGATLLKAAELHLAALGHSRLLWCNARSTAIGFYERLGWVTVGDQFMTDGLLHCVMWKRI